MKRIIAIVALSITALFLGACATTNHGGCCGGGESCCASACCGSCGG